jgi:hypothetical protein
MDHLTDTALETAARHLVLIDGAIMQLQAERKKLIATVERLEALRRRVTEINAATVNEILEI